MTSRAVRNNNPGNLVSGQPWQGLLPPAQMTAEQRAETRFAVFASPKWGFRALAVTLRNYRRRYGIDTVRGIVARFAPPAENDTESYIRGVSGALGVAPDAPLDLGDAGRLAALAKAIAVHESGGWLFRNEDWHAGIRLAEEK
jgi:hypothetical protein